MAAVTANREQEPSESCGICLQPIPPVQMEPKHETLSERWKDSSPPDNPLEDHARNVLSAMEAWQCERCRHWICNDCILPHVIRSRARRMRHRGCGGVFKAPDAPSWVGVIGQRPVPSGSWRARFGIRTDLNSGVLGGSGYEPFLGGELLPAGELRFRELALIAEGIRQSAGVTLSDDQMAIGMAMCDQLEGRRLRRAQRTIETLSVPCTDRDRSLAAALPAFLYARGLYARDISVHVMAPTESRAREDAQLYRRIDGELGMHGVGLIHAGQPRAKREAAYACGITVGNHGEFERDVVSRSVAVVRVARYGTYIDRRYPRVAHLPDSGYGLA